jgi:hypothetical protein
MEEYVVEPFHFLLSPLSVVLTLSGINDLVFFHRIFTIPTQQIHMFPTLEFGGQPRRVSIVITVQDLSMIGITAARS